ncbi:MAG: RNA polymerase sigma factor [Acidobacteria bacterium]|nr:RNA polymerase sigma factor [Acidobacteriota bacterium]MBV9476796.1 RNA polymerase sigma factor [Acidobacteriota bacterium]
MDQTPSPETDEKLFAAWRHAKPEQRRAAADRLFARYYERVGGWCFRLTGERESAADLAQDVFLKAHRHLDSFQGNSQFGTWLYSIARNEAINRSKRAALPMDDSEEALLDVATLEPDPEQLAARNSRARWLQTFLAQTLDEKERTVFTLHYGDELPLDAITRLLRLENSSGAKAYIVSAKRKLARAAQRILARGDRP